MREKIKQINRTRHLMVWHDGSSLANHGHLLITVNIAYDNAMFYSNEEYTALTGEKVDIQTEVEKPEVCIRYSVHFMG